jgi:opacity protein-like surface antigen
MALRSTIAIAALGALCAPAFADQASPSPSTAAPSLPSLAMDPQASSPWTGLYVGSEVMAAFAKGSKPGFGGAAFAGYNREFENNLVIGVQGSTGYAPYLFTHGPSRGFDFAESNVMVGYDMGRFMPYVTAGIALAKPNSFGVPAFTGAADSMNSLFSSGGDLRAFGTVGAGFDYAVTDKLTFGMAVTAGAGHGPFGPLP